jgi:hypothetical protein
MIPPRLLNRSGESRCVAQRVRISAPQWLFFVRHAAPDAGANGEACELRLEFVTTNVCTNACHPSQSEGLGMAIYSIGGYNEPRPQAGHEGLRKKLLGGITLDRWGTQTFA